MVQALLNPASPGQYCHFARPWIAPKPVSSFFSRKKITAACMASATGDKLVWVATNNKEVLTTALESGISTLLVPSSAVSGPAAKQYADWQQLGRYNTVRVSSTGSLLDEQGKEVGVMRRLATPQDVAAAEKEAGREGVVLVEALDWQIIPAENLVAAFQGAGARAQLLALAGSYVGSRVMLEALEAGTHGVVLQTEDPKEVRQLAAYLAQRKAQRAQQLQYTPARVSRVVPVGMGDRACVDLASLLVPGEGLLVGSFARGLFLVHSECGESAYINSRPFRVNAGPVHSYVRVGQRTVYLSELKAGKEVSMADAQGRESTAIVGRVKIESRPLVLVEARTPSGDTLSVLLQNAETVKLVGPADQHQESHPRQSQQQQQQSQGQEQEQQQPTVGLDGGRGDEHSPLGPGHVKGSSVPEGLQQAQQQQQEQPARPPAIATHAGPKAVAEETGQVAAAGPAAGHQQWRTISVSALREGDIVFVLQQHGARHTGISIQEKVKEV